MLMKVISNFIVTNGLVDESMLEEFNSWENKDLWYSIQENLEKDGLIKAERSIDIVLEGLVDLEVGEVAEVLEEVNNSIE